MFEIELDRHVALQRDELAREPRVVRLREQRFPRTLARDVRRPRENRVEIAIRLEQLDGGLIADSFYAGDVVGGVADEREIVDDPLRRHAETLARIRLIDPLFLDGSLSSAPRIEKRHTGSDELIEVLVSRDDDGLQAVVGHALRQGGDHVISLIAVDGEHRNSERVENLADALQGAVEVLL